jgi:hypothetical protein
MIGRDGVALAMKGLKRILRNRRWDRCRNAAIAVRDVTPSLWCVPHDAAVCFKVAGRCSASSGEHWNVTPGALHKVEDGNSDETAKPPLSRRMRASSLDLAMSFRLVSEYRSGYAQCRHTVEVRVLNSSGVVFGGCVSAAALPARSTSG